MQLCSTVWIAASRNDPARYHLNYQRTNHFAQHVRRSESDKAMHMHEDMRHVPLVWLVEQLLDKFEAKAS